MQHRVGAFAIVDKCMALTRGRISIITKRLRSEDFVFICLILQQGGAVLKQSHK